MKITNTSARLKEIMREKNIKQIDILKMIQPICERDNIKMGSNDLSQYVTGKVEPSQKKLSALAEALDTNEVWLMGYDVPKGRNDIVTLNDEYTYILDENWGNIPKGSKIKVKNIPKYIDELSNFVEDMKNRVNRLEILTAKVKNNSPLSNEEEKELFDILNTNFGTANDIARKYFDIK